MSHFGHGELPHNPEIVTRDLEHAGNEKDSAMVMIIASDQDVYRPHELALVAFVGYAEHTASSDAWGFVLRTLIENYTSSETVLSAPEQNIIHTVQMIVTQDDRARNQLLFNEIVAGIDL